MDEFFLKQWQTAKIEVQVTFNGQPNEELSQLAARLLDRERITLWNQAILATIGAELLNDLEDPEYPSLRLSGPAYLAPEADNG